MRWLFLIAMALGSEMVFADSPPLTTIDIEQSATSDKLFLRHHHLSYESARRDLLWPFAGEQDSGLSWGFDGHVYTGASQGINFAGHHMAGVFSQKLNPRNFWQISLGQHQVENESNGEAWNLTTHRLHIDSYLLESQSLSATVEHSSDLSYRDLALPAALTSKLEQQVGRVQLQWRVRELWRLKGAWIHSEFSDANIRNDHQLEAMYGISPGWPWIWAGLNYEHLTNSKNKLGYWTPDVFNSYGVKLEASFPIWQNLSANTELNFRKQKEDELAWGEGKTIFLGLQHGDRDQWLVKFSYMHLQSAQGPTEWTQDSLYLVVNF